MLPPTPPVFSIVPKARSVLVGRDELLAQVLTRLEASGAFVTLLGIGGVGKTRLALACAESFARGSVHFCDLSSCRSTEDVMVALAHTLSIPTIDSAQGVETALLERLATLHDGLLVLDNFETVLPSASSVRRWLDAAPTLRVLVTSRTPLDVEGEQRIEVPPLSTERHGATSPAARLFYARAAERGGSLDDDTHDVVEALVATLDGLPLAIELAAARVRTFPPHVLLPMLGQRFRLLVQSRRDAPERHRSLAATLDTSWERLGPTARTVLTACAQLGSRIRAEALAPLLPGEFDLPTTLAYLQEIQDHSLLHVDHHDAATHVTLLDTVRLYVLERSNGIAPTYFARWADGLVKHREALDDASIGRHLRCLVPHLHHLDPDRLAALADIALSLDTRARHCLTTGERLSLWNALLAHLPASREAHRRARVLLARSSCHRWAAAFDVARNDLLEAEGLTQEDSRLLGDVAAELSRLAFNQWRLHEARDAATRAVVVARQHGDTTGLARALELRAWAHFLAAEHPDALRCYDEAAGLYGPAIPSALAANRALCLLDCGAIDEAERALVAALEIARRDGDALAAATATGFLGALHRRRGACAKALCLFEEAATRCAALGHAVWTVVMEMEAGLTLLDEGRWHDAVARLSRARDRIDAQPGHACTVIVRACLAMALAAVGDLPAARSTLAEASARAPSDGPLVVVVTLLDAALSHPPSSDDPLPPFDAPLWQRLGDHVVIIRRVLERVRERCFPPSHALVVYEGAIRLPGGVTLDGPHRQNLRGMLVALVEASQQAGHPSLDVDTLFRAGWPSQRATRAARANRVRVGLSTLRRLGLGKTIHCDTKGYRLVGVHVVDLRSPPGNIPPEVLMPSAL